MSPLSRGARLAALALVLAACAAESPRLRPAATEPVRLPPALAGLRVVEGTGACAPPGHPDTAFTSCCAGKACLGYCVRDDRTETTGCSCFETEGGCGEGSVCCKAKGRCTTAEECALGRKTP